MRNPYPRIRLVDGFNEGWTSFENGIDGTRKGTTTVEAALMELCKL